MKFKIINITDNPDGNQSILIIYTGGTFGMVYDESGALIPFNFSSVLERIPELKSLGLNLTVISFPEPVDSSNVGSGHWADMAYIIHSNYNQYDGFVILHGTDTMAYSASALSFMLENLNKPVIFTGAQIPIGATRSDARENLITALEMASKTENGKPVINEVCLYFNFVLLRGNRSQKIRSSTFGAFESENYPHLAESGVEIEYFQDRLNEHQSNQTLTYKNKFDPNVVVLKIFPNMTPSLVKGILNIQGLRGVVLESFGSGNTMNFEWFIKLLREAIEKGIIILNVSQCIGGSVLQGKYETSRKLLEIGVLSGGDITTEAALTKMMFLLGNEKSHEVLRSMLTKPLRGEMTI
ncbi:asparaginase [Reichenbachiella sp. MALMAid0571]|uniref:asparaginase n=1 Tax=Reichenbachiella sp. MALMAid0571 TaxID=3143939 RepID=UPI0032DE4C5D